MIELQEIIFKDKKYKDMYKENNEGFNSLYRDLLEFADIRASAHNSDYMAALNVIGGIMKGYVTEDDMIHRLQIIRDLVRDGKKFDADVNLESLQRILAEEKLTSGNSDYVKLPKFDAVYKRAYELDGEKITVATFYECLKELGNFT